MDFKILLVFLLIKGKIHAFKKKLSKKKKEKEETAYALYTLAFVKLKLLKISAYAF